MLRTIEKKVMQQNGNAIKYLTVQNIKNATNINIKNINMQIDRDFGLAGPLTLSTPSLRVHAVRWAVARESFIVETNVKRVNKEIVAACVAQLNKCPYSEDAHSTSIMSCDDAKTGDAIINRTWKELDNKKTKQLINWSLQTRNPHASIIKNPPFSIDEAPEIIGTALAFHSTNRLVNIFLEESPLPSFLTGKLLKKIALKIASKTLFKSMVSNNAMAGDGLQFIQDHPIHKSIEWSKAIPAFSKVLAAEEILLKDIEEDTIPEKLRDLFKNEVTQWEGEEMPLGRGWLNEILINLDENELRVGRLLFLAAFAPYTITKNDINAFRKVKPTDKELIETCFWAIQTVTNKIGEWLIKPFNK